MFFFAVLGVLRIRGYFFPFIISIISASEFTSLSDKPSTFSVLIFSFPIRYLLLKGKILRPGDTLVVKELDRLNRNKAAVKEDLEHFRSEGIRVKILDVPTTLIDSEKQGWVMEMVSSILIEVMSSIAEEERVKNHQRQAEGIEAARTRGVQFGRPKLQKPEGYEDVMRKVADGVLRAEEAMRQLGLKRSSYYKLKNLYPVEGVSNHAGVM